ncbi:TetR/AcrR family transcriptional regulator [Rhodomicrobium sp.]|uniref:TetR/AcrR family transcriptional regulator n=1 Tax=Rhodomicrobium sp. TaxID=2720632 RepID=UPI0039E70E1A
MSDAEQALSIARRARELFCEKGYGRTTMEDIVARCRISKTTLYRLFPTKIDVFAAIIDDHRQEMLALPGDYDDLPIEEALARIFLVDIDEEADRERKALIRFVLIEGQHYPELAALLHERGGDWSMRELAFWLQTQKEKGRITFDNADDATLALMDLMFRAVALPPPGIPEWPDRGDRNAICAPALRCSHGAFCLGRRALFYAALP